MQLSTPTQTSPPSSWPWVAPTGERLGLARHYTDLEMAHLMQHPGARFVFAVPRRVM
jgi:hypothetical protein